MIESKIAEYIHTVSNNLWLTTNERAKLLKYAEETEFQENYKEEITDYLIDEILKKENSNGDIEDGI